MATATVDLIGAPLDRVDGRAKVTGTAKYAAEFTVPGVAHAVAIGATIAKGRITSIDSRAAQNSPGVLAVYTHENMPRAPQRRGRGGSNGEPGQAFVPMQTPDIHYAGQYVALVIAETLAQAQEAAMQVKVSYTAEPPAFWDGEQNEPASKKPQPQENLERVDSSRGDTDAALASAPVVIRPVYALFQEAHNPMEMSAAVAAWQGDKVTVYTATQGIKGAQRTIAEVLQVPRENVKVLCPFVGGGFGCKGSVWPHEYLTAMVARDLHRPVKWMLTRRQMFTGCGNRPLMRQKIEIAADKNGKLAAIAHHVFNTTATYGSWTESGARQTRFLYACPNVRTSHRLIPINVAIPCQMRAPGHAPGTWALEQAMDELAYAVGKDPLELRLLNYSERDEDENKPYSSKKLRACYEQAAARFGWARRSMAPRSMRDGRLLVGWGLATATYPANQSPSSARARLLTDGTALISLASQDLGTGTYTILTQIAAETLGMPIARVKVEIGNSTFPDSPTSGGSQTAASAGNAVKAAAAKARAELVKSAGREQDSSASLDVPAIMRARGTPIDVSVDRFGGRNRDYSTHSHGVQIAEIKIDPDTLEIRVTRVVSRFAIGTVLNHKTARSQVMGGIVMGIGAALLEHAVYDRPHVRIVTSNLADYHVPVNKDIPDIDCDFVEEPDPHINPLGVKGVGELGITGIAGAVANAVFHATGQRIRSMPITLDKLMA